MSSYFVDDIIYIIGKISYGNEMTAFASLLKRRASIIMRYLKKFSTIVIIIVLVTSMIVPALAAVEDMPEVQALKIQSIGLMAGGVADLKLDEGLNRIQGLTFAIRAAGKELEAISMSNSEVESILSNVIDRSSIPNWAGGYAQKYVAYAVKHRYTLGTDVSILPKVKFGPMDPLSGNAFLVFLMKSGMGYGNVTTINVADKAVEACVVTSSQADKYGGNSGISRGDAAGILYNAVMNGVTANGKTLLQSLIDSGVVSRQDALKAGFIRETMKARAIGERKIEIEFGSMVDPKNIGIEVLRGIEVIPTDSITYSKDNRSAIFEFRLDMREGRYIINVSGVSDSLLTTRVTVEEPKLTTIEFLSDVAIKSGNDISVPVRAKNQYGENIIDDIKGAQVYSSEGTGGFMANGWVTVYGTSPTFFKDGDTVKISVVDRKTAFLSEQEFKVAEHAKIGSIEFGEITSDEARLKNKDLTIESMGMNASKYYLPIIVKDEHGNILKARHLHSIELSSSDSSIIRIFDTPIGHHVEKGSVVKFRNTGDGKSGLVTITALDSSSGKMATKTVTISDK